jgi:tetracycline 7-halogenase / FADH2 O2-dependent halogenase
MASSFEVDLAIVGSGFGGSILAMIARRLGYRVLLLERGRHPRFAIGESASPLAGVLIEQLADRYDLPRLRPLSAFGTWQRTYPNVVCGLKRGFTYFKHERDSRYRVAADGANRLLVAASPSDELSDTHWLRSDVDHFLLREAIDLGAEYLDEVTLERIEFEPDGASRLAGQRRAASLRVRAQFVVDASGPRGFLSRALQIPERGFDGYPATQALFSHFVDVPRCADLADFEDRHVPPYPIDDAALHHVFDGGWMWVLRFGNGVTSAGIAVDEALGQELRLADGEAAWHRWLAMYPSIAGQFACARPIREFTWMPRVSYRASAAAGDGWVMLPSAAAFIDPLFSTGIPMTLLGIERLAAILRASGPRPQASGLGQEQGLSSEASGLTPGPALGPEAWALGPVASVSYNDVTLTEADHTARFIAGCYAAFPRFDVFAAYSMFYFVAASFSEMSRRLVPTHPSRGFLFAADPDMSAAIARSSPAAEMPRDASIFARNIAAVCERFNIAGLCDPEKRNLYGVDLEDTVRSAVKLGLSPERVREGLSMTLNV